MNYFHCDRNAHGCMSELYSVINWTGEGQVQLCTLSACAASRGVCRSGWCCTTPVWAVQTAFAACNRCFPPRNKQQLLVDGTEDGSRSVWDLTDTSRVAGAGIW